MAGERRQAGGGIDHVRGGWREGQAPTDLPQWEGENLLEMFH